MFFKEKIQLLLKGALKSLLRPLGRLVLMRQRPNVIGVTGSVGKTSAKEAIFAVFSEKFRARKSIKSYNNELGVPLTIIGENSPENSLIGWIKVFSKGIKLIFKKEKNYPELLILEMGADKKGDLKYLASIIPPYLFKAAVLTAVAPVHLKAFGSLENIFKEKTSIFRFLPKDGWGIVNADLCDVTRIAAQKFKCRLFSYGIKSFARLRLEKFKKTKEGLLVSLCIDKERVSLLIPGALTLFQAYPCLAAVVTGVVFGIKTKEAAFALEKNYISPPGRLRLLKGMRQTLIIDDTYNSSPLAAEKALQALAEFSGAGKKIAVLGDMLELGEESAKYHRRIGQLFVELNLDKLVCFGKESCLSCREAEKKGGKNNCLSFSNQEELIKYLKKILAPKDIVLIKGSQGMRMEKVVKALMAEPEKAKHLLVRQEKGWLKK